MLGSGIRRLGSGRRRILISLGIVFSHTSVQARIDARTGADSRVRFAKRRDRGILGLRAGFGTDHVARRLPDVSSESHPNTRIPEAGRA